MYEFLSLKLNCPSCGKSLMDAEHLVDNEQSIKLDIKINGKTGMIWLSSIYGSYNYTSDIDLPAGEQVSMYCPHCNDKIQSEFDCLVCGANMVSFVLDIGGKVSVCSRIGCKNHSVEFEDLSVALKKLYQEYGYSGNAMPEPDKVKVKEAPKVDETKEIIASGTHLLTYCPHCNKGLETNDQIKLIIVNDKGETGYIMLSPYMNVFTSKSTIFLPEDKVIKDLICPHCNKSLKVDKKCGLCSSDVAGIKVSARTKFLDFYLCTRKGCRWHGLSDDDLYDIKMEDSLEW
jgi:uncharacterized protein (UPF0212 family)/uncharacterized protein YbaR (Trm112 family)